MSQKEETAVLYEKYMQKCVNWALEAAMKLVNSDTYEEKKRFARDLRIYIGDIYACIDVIDEERGTN